MGSSSMWMRLLFPALLVATMSAPVADSLTVSPGCVGRCGDVDIPYPFGIGSGCFRKGFEISCVNNTMPVMAGTTQRVLNLTLSPRPEARVMLPIAWQCFNSTGDVTGDFDGKVNMNPEGVYRISSELNQLVLLGCNTFAQIKSGVSGRFNYQYYTGCVAFANDSSLPQDGACRGVGCCRIDIPPGLTDNVIDFESGGSWTHENQEFCPCDYAFITNRGYYNFQKAHLRHMDVNTSMPLSLDWAIRDNGSLSCAAAATKPGYACISRHSECVVSANGPGYTCNCTTGREGNPYVVDGCTDIDECAPQAGYPCRGTCKNTDGSYECTCRPGYQSNDPFYERCTPRFPLAAQISIGVVGGILLIVIMTFTIIIIKEKKKIHDTYKRNGGPVLEKARTIKLFKKVDLQQIFKNGKLIGKGGFGEVYKGLLGDELVAVKKPISGNVLESKQFPNEVIIQSQIIHKNIVRLIGCCLEVDSPMLVYEFIPRGSMDDILHGEEKKPLSLDVRLNIAVESAQGLAYMHSQTNKVILHGDVKPANILLNDEFAPKISDFGISRLIATDKEHTALVIGDRSYMDPVYLQTGMLTAKSDVYSFGVVILELISRKKATYSEDNSIVKSFLDVHKDRKKSTELFDTEIAVEEDLDLLVSLAELAVDCLNLDVDQRPTMTDVAERLVILKRCRKP
ncbi:hypothetical protein VPH35_018993 [Triticum aestivum]